MSNVVVKQPNQLDQIALAKVNSFMTVNDEGQLTKLPLADLPTSGGADGKSAYEIAVEEGFVGDVTEWLLSLVGPAGDDGKSAYDVAVEDGFVGDVTEWLLTLIGADGKSAYDLAVDGGFEGTLTEWLESLKGKDGADGTGGSPVATVITNTNVDELDLGIYVCVTPTDIKDGANGYPAIEANEDVNSALIEVKGNVDHLVVTNVSYDNGATYTKVSTADADGEWLQVVGVVPGTVLIGAGPVAEGG